MWGFLLFERGNKLPFSNKQESCRNKRKKKEKRKEIKKESRKKGGTNSTEEDEEEEKEDKSKGDAISVYLPLTELGHTD